MFRNPSQNYCSPKAVNTHVPCYIKNLMNKRKRLLKNDRRLGSSSNSVQIKNIGRQVAAYFNESRVSKVRQAAVGGGANLWRAVKLAKNLNSDYLNMKGPNKTIKPLTHNR